MELKGQVLIYSTTGCPHCKAAKSKLDQLKLPWKDVNLDDYPDQRNIMTKITGKMTVPQIFFNDKHIGGNDDFQNMSPEKLDELIAYVRDVEPPLGTPEFEAEQYNANSKEEFLNTNEKKDELAQFVETFSKQNNIICSHKSYLLISHSKTFTGADLITYIAHEKNVERNSAKNQAQVLLDKRYAASIKPNLPMEDNSTLYRLVQDWPSSSLNAGIPSYLETVSAPHLSGLIRKSILIMYAKYLSPDGKAVDYVGIGECQEFVEYKMLTGHLQRVQLGDLSQHEKLTFFVNIYNALVIHGNIQFGFPESTYQRYKFFNRASYMIGLNDYSLQDIENGILRSNRKGVGMLSRPFKTSDPRHKYILVPAEPLIHFALVCGAKSCPPIKTYSTENVIGELEMAASAFLESDDGCRVDKNQKMIGLSMIFKWYKEDFGETQEKVLNWVVEHMADSDKKLALTTLLNGKQYKLVYLTYDWGTNKK